MATTDARPVPRKGVAFRLYFAIRKSDGTLYTSWAAQDSEVSLDGGSFTDCTNEATEIGTSGCGYLDLTSSETNADSVVLKITTTGGLPLVVTLFPEKAGDYRADVTHFGGTAGTFSGGRPEVNTTHVAGTAWGSADLSATMKASVNAEADTAVAEYGALKPTVPGRTLDVTSTGEAGIDWANIGGQSSTVALSGTTILLTSAYDAAKTAAAQTDVNTLLSRLSASRAGYLDNLNCGGVVAAQSDINALNQSASRRVMLSCVEMWERPESGTTSITIEARTWDGDGAATNADSTPTLTATGETSGSLAASLGSATNTATGVYRWTFSVSSSATLEQVTLDLSATIGSTPFTMSKFCLILDAVSATWTTSDRTKLTAIYDKLPLRAYFTGTTVNSGAIASTDMAAMSDAIWDDTTTEHQTAGTMGAYVQSLATASSLATAAGNIASILGKFTGITLLARWLGLLAGKTADSTTLAEMQATMAGDTFTNTTDSLEAIRDRGDSSWGGGGSGLTGANLVTITVTDGVDPVPGAAVRLKAGGSQEVKRTNGSGVVTFTVDDNTWTVTISANNLTFEATTLVVTEDTSATYEMDTVLTTGTTWATGDDMVAYFDARTFGQLLSDTNTAVAVGDVPDHPIMTRMLKLATGSVNSALTASKRYTTDQLSELEEYSTEVLRQITCDIAMFHLTRRRIDINPEKQEKLRTVVNAHLERLRKGEIVLEIDTVQDAGVAQHAELTQSIIQQGVPSIRDQVGYYPPRNLRQQ